MKFSATTRSVQGSSASRRLRRAGRVPAIVYGGKGDAQNIELDHNEIFHALRKPGFGSSVLEMNLDSKTQKVLLRAVQWHPYKPIVLHVDFQRVRADVAIVTRVPLTYINADESPAVKLEGASINTILTDIEVSCLPADLPSEIVVDLGEMKNGDVLSVESIAAPEGVEFLTAATETLATAAIVAVQAEVEPEETEGDESTATEAGESTSEE
ncbi:General stress protein CTC [Oligella ureolytica]|uniref:50S ribosomal protein L25/general stress protein Ctc n=1 Tax=Oligella ureolytica TaxID=90244 RepID=UPI000DFFC340|nr:50S ribosomal protein L25/general stress protein Ctc [Oligella ureolytica]SUA57924.1 General stress protein CTC [Oligella ureolytica]